MTEASITIEKEYFRILLEKESLIVKGPDVDGDTEIEIFNRAADTREFIFLRPGALVALRNYLNSIPL